MAAADPSTGSFADYAGKALGAWASMATDLYSRIGGETKTFSLQELLGYAFAPAAAITRIISPGHIYGFSP